MCIIIDANVAGTVIGNLQSPDVAPVFEWLENRGGKLVIGGELTRELHSVITFKRYLAELVRGGRVRQFDDTSIRQESMAIAQSCKSNDTHIIALARVSGARVLYSNDRDLHSDFRNKNLINRPRGAVYQNKNHKPLLKHSKSCGQ